MDYHLIAARRVMAIGAESPRARSIINDARPVFLLPAADDAFDDAPLDQFTGVTAELLAGLVTTQAPRIGLLEVKYKGAFYPIATAWPVLTTGPVDNPGSTCRFLTAGHALRTVLEDHVTLEKAGDVATATKRSAQVVFDKKTLAVTRWICSCDLDLAVFEVAADCPALLLQLDAPRPASVAIIGFPLREGEQVFAEKESHYVGRQFLAIGNTRTNEEGVISAETQFLHDATTLPGFSGAPIFDPEQGFVVGMHFQGSAKGLETRAGAVGQRGSIDFYDGDLNDALLASGLHRLPWLVDILNGGHDVPDDAATLLWRGGDVPTAVEPVEGRPLPILMADAGGRWRGVAAADQGVVPDREDTRDSVFQPGLSPAAQQIIPQPGPLGDQGDEGSCAAFAVAAAIEHQLALRDGYAAPERGLTASARMLDRMARRHDEWLDDTPDGTSLRAVLKGFYHNGVCPEALCTYVPRSPAFFLTRAIAKEAQKITLGAYQRVRLSVDDMRMAIAQGRAVIVTAHIHDGWSRPDADGRIPFSLTDTPPDRGCHAFAVTGYDQDGFIVQNSRGAGWGGYRDLPGHALWSFADWAENCRDAWAIRLAPPGEKAFALSPTGGDPAQAPRRLGLLGHALHAERFGLITDGTLGLGAQGIAETAAYLDSEEGRRKYDRLMLIFHEPLMTSDLIATLAQRLTMRLKARGIYPFHIIYGVDEMMSCRLRLSYDVGRAVERYLREGTSRDAALQRQLGPIIRTQVSHFIQGARSAATTLLRDAMAPLMLFAAPDRRVDAVSVGLGGVVAQAVIRSLPAQRPPAPRPALLAIACPVQIRATRHWLLGRATDETDLPGWAGSWGDIVAGAFERSIRTDREKEPIATVQQLLLRPDFVPELLTRLPRAVASQKRGARHA